MEVWEAGVQGAGWHRRSHSPSLLTPKGRTGRRWPTRLRTVPCSKEKRAVWQVLGIHLRQTGERRPEYNTCRPARRAPVNVRDAQPGTPHWHTPQATHQPPLTLSCGSVAQIRIQFFEPRSTNSSSRRPGPCRRRHNHHAVRLLRLRLHRFATPPLNRASWVPPPRHSAACAPRGVRQTRD